MATKIFYMRNEIAEEVREFMKQCPEVNAVGILDFLEHPERFKIKTL